MGKIGKMMRQMEAMMNLMAANQNPAPVLNNTPIQAVPANAHLGDQLTAAIRNVLLNFGFTPQALNQRGADGNTALTSNEVSSSISGPNLTLWKLKELKNKIAPNNFVAALPATTGQIQGGAPNSTWTTNDVATITAEYQKLATTVNELKTLLAGLEIN